MRNIFVVAGAVFLCLVIALSVVLGATLPRPNGGIICPPFMDKAIYEIKGVYVWYELDQGPTEYTELGYEFVETCGYTIIHDPVRIEPPEPPPPEEGGA